MIEKWINNKILNSVDELALRYKRDKPFPHILIKDFLDKKKIIELRDAVKKERFELKESDLFQFKQTYDLSESNNKVIREFYSLIKSKEFANFMKNLTGLQVKPGVLDFSASLYEDTDYLLCHDDQISDRKIAYIIYLSEDFSEKDGGSFNLLDSIGKKVGRVTQKYYPKFNSIMIFSVNERSFHEVEEVVGKKRRYAIGGWLH